MRHMIGEQDAGAGEDAGEKQAAGRQDSTNYVALIIMVAILSLAIIIVLGGYSDVRDSGPELSSHAYWRMADVGIADWNVSGSTITLTVQNNRQYRIRLNYVVVEGYNTTMVLNSEMSTGSHQTVTAAGPYCLVGSRYSYNVTIGYDNTENNITNQVFTGTQDIIGAC